ncbi:MAG: choice-of-anchor H family protein [Bacteroidales bacterium]|nr:choice-of-anchor H family protein [Bacteroidales bacterium]
MQRKPKLFFAIFAVSALVSISSCKKKEIDYTYTLTGIEWVDQGIDVDGDGYVTSRTLKCQISLLENVTRDIEVKIYFRLAGSQEYIYYGKIEADGITGGTENPVLIPIGLSQDLSHGTYTFLLEVYEKDNQRLEASGSIEDNKFERLVNDQVYDLKVWWSDPDDVDRDGFLRTATLNIDVNVKQQVTKTVKVEVFYRSKDSTRYHSYFTSDNYSITGENRDTLEVPTGFYPDTLGHGLYDFKIIVYEENVSMPVLIYDRELSSELGERPFETDLDDGYIFSLNMENTEWVQVVDLDTDGYAQLKVLNVDVDIDKDEPVNIFAKIYRQGPNDEHYLVLDSTGIFQINGQTAADIFLFPVNSTLVTDTVQMPHGEYNLMLAIFRVFSDQTNDLRFATDSIDGMLLRQQKFELASEDSI